MLSFDRRQIVIASLAASAALLAPAAGFGAVPGGAMSDDLGQLRNAVAISPLNGRDARLMANALENRLGRCARDARYGLFHALKFDNHPVTMTPDSITAHGPLKGQMTYALNDLKSGVVLTAGKVAVHGDGEGVIAMLAEALVARLIAASRALPA